MLIKVLPHKGFKIRLWLPMGAMKWRWVYRSIGRHSEGTFDFNALGAMMPRLVKEVRKYIRRHGHFNLVEIKSHDGDYVLIRL